MSLRTKNDKSTTILKRCDKIIQSDSNISPFIFFYFSTTGCSKISTNWKCLSYHDQALFILFVVSHFSVSFFFLSLHNFKAWTSVKQQTKIYINKITSKTQTEHRTKIKSKMKNTQLTRFPISVGLYKTILKISQDLGF